MPLLAIRGRSHVARRLARLWEPEARPLGPVPAHRPCCASPAPVLRQHAGTAAHRVTTHVQPSPPATNHPWQVRLQRERTANRPPRVPRPPLMGRAQRDATSAVMHRPLRPVRWPLGTRAARCSTETERVRRRALLDVALSPVQPLPPCTSRCPGYRTYCAREGMGMGLPGQVSRYIL